MKREIWACLIFWMFFKNAVKSENSASRKSNNSSAENECKPNESCVRLCCHKSDPILKCADLKLKPEYKNLETNFKMLKGKPCGVMLANEDPWDFFSVRLF
jgi:hypothetical protein